MLTDNPARSALGHPEPLTQHHNGATAAVRGSDVSLRQTLKHVDIQSLIRDQASSTWRSVPRAPSTASHHWLSCRRTGRATDATLTLRPVKASADLIQPLAAGEEPVPLSDLANNLVRRMPSPLGCHDVIPPSPKRVSESHNAWTTLGGSPQDHLTDETARPNAPVGAVAGDGRSRPAAVAAIPRARTPRPMSGPLPTQTGKTGLG